MQNTCLPPRSLLPLKNPAFASLLILIILGPGMAHAQSEPNHLYDKFQISASGTEVLIGPRIKLDGDASPGTEVNAGSVLGIDRSGFEPRFAFRWRPSKRHEIEVGYLFINRSGEKRLTRDISVRDTTFNAGLKINSTLGADNAFLAYRFSFAAKENTQIAAQLGLGLIFFKIGIDALAGSTNGNDSLTTSRSVSGDFTGPTAALGLSGRFRFGDRWYLETNAGAIGISIENITATVFQGGAAGRYFLSKRFGLEAGYGVTGVKITVDKEGSGGLFDPAIEGSIKYPYQDFRLGVIAAFQ